MASADLSVTVDDGKTSVVPGVNYDVQFGFQPNFPFRNDYTVTVTNNGPDTVTSLELVINPGAGLTLFGWNNPSANGSQGVVNINGDPQHFTWSGLSLANGQSVFDTFIYSID